MLKYDEQLCRQMTLNTTLLYQHFQMFKTDDDKFGKVALAKVFCQVIIKSPYHSEEYKKLLDEKYRVVDLELMGSIESIIRDYGWRRFVVALMNVLKKNKTDKVKNVLTKLDNLPKELKL